MPPRLSGRTALFLALQAPALVGALDALVQVGCPGLSGEQAAEVESRVRANLLGVELMADVAISCEADVAKVRVEALGETVELESAVSSSTAQDDLVGAVDRALGQLLARRAAARAHSPAPDEPAERAPVAPQPAAPASFAPNASAPDRSVPREPPPRASVTEVAALALGEAWQDRFALGGGVAVARRARSLWYGFRAGALVPLGESPNHDALECHASLKLGWQPRWAAATRLGFGFGPSVLLATPNPRLTSRGDTTVAAFFAELELSRAFRLGSLGFVPSIGARLFTSTRGVRVNGRQQLQLSGLVPSLGLALAYIGD